ncbi:hypothetical protein DPV78_008132 [Talaromyces pinophilus]|nr:hypothetical protein DPV78_008132 [Talaromyces pinophilus]
MSYSQRRASPNGRFENQLTWGFHDIFRNLEVLNLMLIRSLEPLADIQIIPASRFYGNPWDLSGNVIGGFPDIELRVT